MEQPKQLIDYAHTVTDKMVLFWGGPFSQWTGSFFIIGDKEFNCAEQFMMFNKACLFGDGLAALKIMSTPDPKEQKALGRKIKGFNAELWKQVAKGIVYIGNWNKFTQNEEFKKVLLDTGDRIIVEASPYDKIWGIGLSENDPRAQDVNQWQGLNWLGEVLMAVRNDLRKIP